jgi:hypothetical protein
MVKSLYVPSLAMSEGPSLKPLIWVGSSRNDLAFQKKSKTGRATPRRDIERIKQRLREADRIAREMEP